jgi:hypothetical protein
VPLRQFSQQTVLRRVARGLNLKLSAAWISRFTLFFGRFSADKLRQPKAKAASIEEAALTKWQYKETDPGLNGLYPGYPPTQADEADEAQDQETKRRTGFRDAGGSVRRNVQIVPKKSIWKRAAAAERNTFDVRSRNTQEICNESSISATSITRSRTIHNCTGCSQPCIRRQCDR